MKKVNDNRIVNFSINGTFQFIGLDKIDWLLSEVWGLKRISNTVYQAEYETQTGEKSTKLYVVNRKPGNKKSMNVELIEYDLSDNGYVDVFEMIKETDVIFEPAVLNNKYTYQDNKDIFKPLYMQENHIKVEAKTMHERSQRVKWKYLNKDIYEYLMKYMKSINLLLKHLK